MLKENNCEAVVRTLDAPRIKGIASATTSRGGALVTARDLQIRQRILDILAGASDNLCTSLCSDGVCRESAAGRHGKASRECTPEEAEFSRFAPPIRGLEMAEEQSS